MKIYLRTMLEIKTDIGLQRDARIKIEEVRKEIEIEGEGGELKITVDSERIYGKVFVFLRGKRDKVNNAVERFRNNGLEIIRKVETEIDNMNAVVAC